jgi:hypothetical protein
MTSRTLSKRLARLETRLMPATEPLVYEIQFISPEDGSVTSRLQLGGNRPPAGGPRVPHAQRCQAAVRWSVRAIVRRLRSGKPKSREVILRAPARQPFCVSDGGGA